MEQPVRPRSLKNKISLIGRGMRLGLSGRPSLKQARPPACLPNLPRKTPETGLSLADLLDGNAELPYTTVVEGLEEFLYQSELRPHA